MVAIFMSNQIHEKKMLGTLNETTIIMGVLQTVQDSNSQFNVIFPNSRICFEIANNFYWEKNKSLQVQENII
jgi:hypothetical protein